MERTSATLWDAWLSSHDDAAFEKLVRPQLPALYDAARRQGLDGHAAEDVVQDALCELARRRDARPGQVGIGAWLMRAVRLKTLVRHRARRRRAFHETRGAASAGARPPGAQMEVGEEVERALGRLGEADRQILLFRFLYDLDYREIAYVLGVSENACRIRVHRASTRLRGEVGSRGPALLALLPLVDPPNAAGALAAATKGVAATGGAAATWIGGALMGTATKMVGAAAAAAALTAGAFLALDEPREDAPAPLATEAPRSTGGSASAEPGLAGTLPTEAFVGMDPTPAEVAWLRERLLQERERRERATLRPADSGIDVLERVFVYGLDPSALMADFDAFAARVKTGEGASRSFASQGEAPTAVDLTRLGAEGVRVVEFGPGRFELRGLRGFGQTEPTQSLEIRGAGMDETVLLLSDRGELMVTAQLTNLRIADLTLELENDSMLLDVRDQAAAVLERVRLRDWASGGHSAALGVSGRAYLGLRACELDGGGRGGVFAISLRGPGLLDCEDCVFRGTYSSFSASAPAQGSYVRMAGCRFDEVRLVDSRSADNAARPYMDLRVQGARATFGPPELDPATRREQWGAPFARELAGTTLEPAARRATRDDLVAILRGLAVPRGEILVAAEVVGFEEGRPSSVLFATASPETRRTTTHLARREKDGWTARPTRQRATAPRLRAEDRPRGLAASLADADVPAGVQVISAHLELSRVQPAGAERPIERWLLWIGPGRGRGNESSFDAATGEAITNR